MIKISWTMRQTDKTRPQIYPNGCGQCSNKSVKETLEIWRVGSFRNRLALETKMIFSYYYFSNVPTFISLFLFGNQAMKWTQARNI